MVSSSSSALRQRRGRGTRCTASHSGLVVTATLSPWRDCRRWSTRWCSEGGTGRSSGRRDPIECTDRRRSAHSRSLLSTSQLFSPPGSGKASRGQWLHSSPCVPSAPTASVTSAMPWTLSSTSQIWGSTSTRCSPSTTPPLHAPRSTPTLTTPSPPTGWTRSTSTCGDCPDMTRHRSGTAGRSEPLRSMLCHA